MTTSCGCDRQHKIPLLALDEVLQKLYAKGITLTEVESCRIEKVSGRVVAQDYLARYAVPHADNSAMDGYAFRYADIPESKEMLVSQRVPAGVLPHPLNTGTCARIFTGALIPEGADTVIMQEDVVPLAKGWVKLPPHLHLGTNVRKKGEDLLPGTKMISKGVRLGPAECGVLASQGINEVTVYRPLKIAVLSTGDELIEPHDHWSEGKLFNSNRYTLMAGIESLGMDVIDIGIVKDNYLLTRQKLLEASQQADVIISTGGVSVGEEDHVRTCVAELGELGVWGVAIKPGKPFAFGHVNGTPFLGLPGNPVATLVTFDLLAIPFLKLSQGLVLKPVRCFRVKSAFSRAKTIPRQEYVRVNLIDRQSEQLAALSGNQGSGVMSAACQADGYLIIPPNTTIQEGNVYDYLPYTEFRW